MWMVHHTCIEWNWKLDSNQDSNAVFHEQYDLLFRSNMLNIWSTTSTGIDADASKGETSPGYFYSKLV